MLLNGMNSSGTNREYLVPQIRSMNNRFHSEAKLPWSYDYPLANHIATNKSSANREMPLFSHLYPSFMYLRNIFPPRGLKYSLLYYTRTLCIVFACCHWPLCVYFLGPGGGAAWGGRGRVWHPRPRLYLVCEKPKFWHNGGVTERGRHAEVGAWGWAPGSCSTVRAELLENTQV